MSTDKRIYVGGLFSGVTNTELTDRFAKFGEVKDVELKVKNSETEKTAKTFAYVTLHTTDEKLQKCVALYNRTKWKGSELRLQLAKESFLSRLVKERQSPEESPKPRSWKSGGVVYHNPLEKLSDVHDYHMPGAAPGTPIPGENNWIVGKYGRIMPIVRLEDKRKRKIVQVDPSKLCHNLKKFKAEVTECDRTEQLTWNFDGEDKEIDRRRQGEFPAWKPVAKVTETKVAKVTETRQTMLDSPTIKPEDDSFEFQIVPIEKSKPKSLDAKDVNTISNQKVDRIEKTSVPAEMFKDKHSKSKQMSASSIGNNLLTDLIPKHISGTKHKNRQYDSDDSLDSDDTDEIIKMSKEQIHGNDELHDLSFTENTDMSDSENSEDTDKIVDISQNNELEKKISNSQNVEKSRQSFISERRHSLNIASEPKKIRLQLQEFRGTKLLLSNSDIDVSNVKSSLQNIKKLNKDFVDVSISTNKLNSSSADENIMICDGHLSEIVESQPVENASKSSSENSDTDNGSDLHCKTTDHVSVNSENDNRKTNVKRKTNSEIELPEPVSANRHSWHSDLEKSLNANKKRLESVKQRQKDNMTQKSIIQQALKSVDKVVSQNKIIFDSDEEQMVGAANSASGKDVSEDQKDISDSSSCEKHTPVKKHESSKSIKATLFEKSTGETSSDSDDEDERFKIKPQFEGTAGKKLMNLQTRYGNDERFRLDTRFKDSGSDNADTDDETPAVQDDEKARSLKILEDVVGHRIVVPKSKQKDKKSSFKDVSALRFDPTNDDHSQFEIKSTVETQKSKSKVKKKHASTVSEEKVEITPEVGKDKFFEVTDSLRKAFMNTDKPAEKQEGFSLLATFGQQQDEDSSDDNLEVLPDKPLTVTEKVSWQQQSPDDEESDVELGTANNMQPKEKNDSVPVITKHSPEVPALPRKRLTFFFTEDDERLKEGAEFYRKESVDVIREKWLEKRPNLVEAYKTKHKNMMRKQREKQKHSAGSKTRRFSK